MPKKNKRRHKIFNASQLIILDQACQVARDLVANAYHLDFDDIHTWPVDIKRYHELSGHEIAEGVFAQLLRYQRQCAGGTRRDYYRICIYDPSILSALEAEPSLSLEPLLTYIITHEFIHVARFIRFMEIFNLDDHSSEEKIVHRETFRLLKNARLSGLDLVFALYEKHRLPVD